MSITKSIIILLLVIKGTLSYCQTNNAVISSFFNFIPIDSSQEIITSFVEKSNNFENKRISITENGRIIRASVKNTHFYKFKPDTTFFSSDFGNDIELRCKTLVITVEQFFKSQKKARNEFWSIKKQLDILIDTSLRKNFSTKKDKFYSYQITKNAYYPRLTISLETEVGFETNWKKYRVLSIECEKKAN